MKKKLELLEVDVIVLWEGSLGGKRAMTMETKPTYSLKLKILFKLDLNRNIDPTMAGNLI